MQHAKNPGLGRAEFICNPENRQRILFMKVTTPKNDLTAKTQRRKGCLVQASHDDIIRLGAKLESRSFDWT
jgi:hypothetical protein